MPCYWHTAHYGIVQGFPHHPPTAEQQQLSAASYSWAVLSTHLEFGALELSLAAEVAWFFFFPGIVARGQFPYHQN